MTNAVVSTKNTSGARVTAIQISSFSELAKFSAMVASSSFAPKSFQGKQNDIFLAIQMGSELGLSPMQALQNIAVINGKPSVYGDAMLALIMQSPLCEDVIETISGGENPMAICEVKRKGKSPVVSKFSRADATKAGLWGKAGPWTTYPNRMLQMRARGFALRDAFPDLLRGLITAEEAQDYDVDVSNTSNKQTSNHSVEDAEVLETTTRLDTLKDLLSRANTMALHEKAEKWWQKICSKENISENNLSVATDLLSTKYEELMNAEKASSDDESKEEEKA